MGCRDRVWDKETRQTPRHGVWKTFVKNNGSLFGDLSVIYLVHECVELKMNNTKDRTIQRKEDRN